MATANSRIACWPFVTEYKLHKGPSSLSPHAAHAGADIDAHASCRPYGRSRRRHRPCRPREKAEQSIGNEARSRSVDMPVAFILAMGGCRLNASELGSSGERGLRP